MYSPRALLGGGYVTIDSCPLYPSPCRTSSASSISAGNGGSGIPFSDQVAAGGGSLGIMNRSSCTHKMSIPTAPSDGGVLMQMLFEILYPRNSSAKRVSGPRAIVGGSAIYRYSYRV